MLKIPTFIIGGILILTGVVGFVFQNPGLSVKVTGPLADDATFILSDGKQTHELAFMPSDSAGENVWWVVHKLNQEHAKNASQGNYAAKNGAEYETKSFWYASASGDTLKGLFGESDYYASAGTAEVVEPVDWSKIDVNSSKLRLIYINSAGNSGPVTLESSNWQNILTNPALKPNEKLTFSKSKTAFIPAVIGLLLIVLALASESFPNARKHLMHVAALIGVIGFAGVFGQIGTSIKEMKWLKSEPYGIMDASLLKPAVFLITGGLLVIFVILCITSFIEARKQRKADEKLNAEKIEKKEQKKKAITDSEDKVEKNITKEKDDAKDGKEDSEGKVEDNKSDARENKNNPYNKDEDGESDVKDREEDSEDKIEDDQNDAKENKDDSKNKDIDRESDAKDRKEDSEDKDEDNQNDSKDENVDSRDEKENKPDMYKVDSKEEESKE